MTKKVEIDEADLAVFRGTHKFLQDSLKNPATRRRVLEIQKELYPNDPVPELDAAKPVLDAVESLRAELKSLREETAKDKEERLERERLTSNDAKWRQTQELALKAGYTGEGLKKLEEFMAAEGIANHAHAIAAFERVNPPPSPVASSGRFDPFASRSSSDVDLKPLFEGDEAGFLSKTINETLRAVRGHA